MNTKSLVPTIYPGELFLLKFFHFLGTTETRAVGLLSSVVLECPTGTRDSQLIITWLWGCIFSCRNGNCQHYFCYLLLQLVASAQLYGVTKVRRQVCLWNSLVSRTMNRSGHHIILWYYRTVAFNNNNNCYG